MALSTGPPHRRGRRFPPRDNDAVPGEPPRATTTSPTTRAIPGMTVIDPMDATELSAALDGLIARRPGPVYLRGLRGEVPAVLEAPVDFVVGSAPAPARWRSTRVHRLPVSAPAGRSKRAT